MKTFYRHSVPFFLLLTAIVWTTPTHANLSKRAKAQCSWLSRQLKPDKKLRDQWRKQARKLKDKKKRKLKLMQLKLQGQLILSRNKGLKQLWAKHRTKPKRFVAQCSLLLKKALQHRRVRYRAWLKKARKRFKSAAEKSKRRQRSSCRRLHRMLKKHPKRARKLQKRKRFSWTRKRYKGRRRFVRACLSALRPKPRKPAPRKPAPKSKVYGCSDGYTIVKSLLARPATESDRPLRILFKHAMDTKSSFAKRCQQVMVPGQENPNPDYQVISAQSAGEQILCQQGSPTLGRYRLASNKGEFQLRHQATPQWFDSKTHYCDDNLGVQPCAELTNAYCQVGSGYALPCPSGYECTNGARKKICTGIKLGEACFPKKFQLRAAGMNVVLGVVNNSDVAASGGGLRGDYEFPFNRTCLKKSSGDSDQPATFTAAVESSRPGELIVRPFSQPNFYVSLRSLIKIRWRGSTGTGLWEYNLACITDTPAPSKYNPNTKIFPSLFKPFHIGENTWSFELIQIRSSNRSFWQYFTNLGELLMADESPRRRGALYTSRITEATGQKSPSSSPAIRTFEVLPVP